MSQRLIVPTLTPSLNAFGSVVVGMGVADTALLVTGALVVSLVLPEAAPHAANIRHGAANSDLAKPMDFPSPVNAKLLPLMCRAFKSLASLSFWLSRIGLTAISRAPRKLFVEGSAPLFVAPGKFHSRTIKEECKPY